MTDAGSNPVYAHHDHYVADQENAYSRLHSDFLLGGQVPDKSEDEWQAQPLRRHHTNFPHDLDALEAV